MIETLESLINKYVLAYLALVVGGQVLVALVARSRRSTVRKRRLEQGLDEAVLIDHTEKLSEMRREAITPALALAATVFLGPFVVVGLARLLGGQLSSEEWEGLILVLLGLVLWILWSGTDVAKAFLSGLAFKTLVAVKCPLQVGDRLTVHGHTGKVTGIGIFYVTLRLGGGDLVSIPTQGLWSEVLISKNAGQRSSLCVMTYFLSPRVTQSQRQAAEDAVWEAMQASPYVDPSRPMRVYISQHARSIVLTAKAFVALTYNQALFESDVARAFLDRCAAEGIPLPCPSSGED